MKLKRFITLLAIFLTALQTFADINLQVTYMQGTTEITTSESFAAEAPLHVHFESNPSSLDPGAAIEWNISNVAAGLNLVRYEESFDFDFTQAGQNVITLSVRQDNMIVQSASIIITISASHLEMPNAFSPNGDGINDIYRAKKDKYKSIIEFHAYIFNRWGQKLYEWSDITQGWDGTHHGRPVKDGTYFVLVKARGADGIEYNIRRDVNLIRNHNTVENSTN
jgi:gliding motility-associated-like protein